VDEKGKMKSHTLVRTTNPLLTRITEKYLDEINWKPSAMNGKNIESVVILPIEINLK
jgi:hypothetical protein